MILAASYIWRFLVATAAAKTASSATSAATRTASSATSATTKAASFSTAATRIGSGTSHINGKSASFQIGAVNFVYCLLGLILRRHFHEPETSRFIGESVPYQIDRFDLAKGFESLTQIIFGYLTGQIAYINIHFDFLP